MATGRMKNSHTTQLANLIYWIQCNLKYATGLKAGMVKSEFSPKLISLKFSTGQNNKLSKAKVGMRKSQSGRIS